jgi:hypothetical protein
MTYTEAGEIIGLSMRNPHHRRLLGQYLGTISSYEVDHGRPMLSAIVIQKGEKKPGSGFFQLGEEIGKKPAVEDDATFGLREIDRVIAYWTRPREPSDEATKSGAPDYRSREKLEEPPQAIGPCGFETDLGQPCINPGRWDRDGTLSCTTHALAHAPRSLRDASA